MLKLKAHCPEPDCAAIFEIESAREGRVTACPSCCQEVTVLSEGIWSDVRRQSRLAGRSLVPSADRVLVLDNVRSQWNVGSILRTADGAGWGHVALCGITPPALGPAVAKTALGAERFVEWSHHADIVAVLEGLQAAGYQCVALEQTDRALSIASLSPKGRLALVVGSEVAGVSPQALRRCSSSVEIPMRGRKESLNVAVAVGVATFALS